MTRRRDKVPDRFKGCTAAPLRVKPDVQVIYDELNKKKYPRQRPTVNGTLAIILSHMIVSLPPASDMSVNCHVN